MSQLDIKYEKKFNYLKGKQNEFTRINKTKKNDSC